MNIRDLINQIGVNPYDVNNMIKYSKIQDTPVIPEQQAVENNPQTINPKLQQDYEKLLQNQLNQLNQTSINQTPKKQPRISDIYTMAKEGSETGGIGGGIKGGFKGLLSALSTPTALQIGGAIAAMTGNPYIGSSVAKEGDLLRQQQIQKEQLLQQEQDKQQKLLQDYLGKIKGTNMPIPEGFEVYKYDVLGRPMMRIKGSDSTKVYAYEDGELKEVGEVPKGAKTYKGYKSPEEAAAITTATEEAKLPFVEKKADIAAKSAAKKESAIRQEKLEGLEPAIQLFEESLLDLPVGKGISGKLSGKALEIAGRLGLNAEAAGYTALMEGMRTQIAKGLGEVGNLTEQEQEYAMALLPQLSDNKETRIVKLKNFKRYIELKKQQAMGKKTGQDFQSVGRFKVEVE